MKKTALACIFAALMTNLCFAQMNFKASKAEFIEGVTDDENNANKNGVFPVCLSWNKVPLATSYTIMEKDENDEWKTVASLKESQLSFQNNRFSYIHKDLNAVADSFVTYKVMAWSTKLLETSWEDIGWGALTALRYMDTYNENVIKSHSKLTLMHKRINLQKLGKDTSLGEISGYLKYDAHVRGLNGVVEMEYSNYSEKIQWILNGYTNTKANIWANGNMYGTVKCIGMYPGSVCYDNIEIKKGKAHGGYYTIKRKGFPDATVVWDSILSEINHLYKESED